MSTPVKVNPKELVWTHAGKWQDDAPFLATDFAGWQLYSNGVALVSVPRGWETDGEYTYPIADLKLAPGMYTFTMTLKSKNGLESPQSPAAVFQIARIPAAPLALSVA